MQHIRPELFAERQKTPIEKSTFLLGIHDCKPIHCRFCRVQRIKGVRDPVCVRHCPDDKSELHHDPFPNHDLSRFPADVQGVDDREQLVKPEPHGHAGLVSASGIFCSRFTMQIHRSAMNTLSSVRPVRSSGLPIGAGGVDQVGRVRRCCCEKFGFQVQSSCFQLRFGVFLNLQELLISSRSVSIVTGQTYSFIAAQICVVDTG